MSRCHAHLDFWASNPARLNILAMAVPAWLGSFRAHRCRRDCRVALRRSGAIQSIFCIWGTASFNINSLFLRNVRQRKLAQGKLFRAEVWNSPRPLSTFKRFQLLNDAKVQMRPIKMVRTLCTSAYFSYRVHFNKMPSAGSVLFAPHVWQRRYGELCARRIRNCNHKLGCVRHLDVLDLNRARGTSIVSEPPPTPAERPSYFWVGCERHRVGG